MLQQIPIEEILEEFRQKYADDVVVEQVVETCPEAKQEPSPVIVSVKRGRRCISFRRIVAIQSAVAVAIIVALAAMRLFNSSAYEHVAEFLRARL